MVITGPPSVMAMTPPPIAHAAAGCIGSALSLLLFYPLERARIELQAHAPDDDGDENDLVRKFDTQSIQNPSKRNGFDKAISVSQSPVLEPTAKPILNYDRSIVSCLIRLRKRKQLYRGVRPVVATLALSNFIFFYALQACKQILATHKQNLVLAESAYQSLLATSLAGVANVLLTNPLWVVNLRLVQGDDQGSHGEYDDNGTAAKRGLGFFDILKDIATREGVEQLWSGTGASLLLVSNPAIQLFIYEQGKTHLLQHHTFSFLNPWRIWKAIRWDAWDISPSSITSTNLNPLEAFLLGAISKGIATVLTYPLQLAQVVVRLQRDIRNTSAAQQTLVQNKNGPKSQDENYHNLISQHSKRFRGTWDCIFQLYRKGGLQALYTGMDAKLLLNILSAAFTFLTYEQILMFITTGRI